MKQFVMKPAALGGMLLALLASAFALGCDKIEEITEQAEQAGKTVQERVEQQVQHVQEIANLAGNIELQLQGPVSTQACYGMFLPLPSQTGNVLQLASYRAPEQEAFPSVFIRANVGSAASWAELAGQTVQAELFVKTSTDDAAWHTAPAAPVELTIGDVGEGQLTAEVAGELTRGGETSPVSGSLTAVFE